MTSFSCIKRLVSQNPQSCSSVLIKKRELELRPTGEEKTDRFSTFARNFLGYHST